MFTILILGSECERYKQNYFNAHSKSIKIIKRG